MKKIHALFLVVGLLVCDAALAAGKCLPSNCPANHSEIGENREYIRTHVNGDRCFACDSNDHNSSNEECPYDEIVCQRDADGYCVGLYRCVDMFRIDGVDHWQKFNPTQLCKYSPVKRKTENTKTFYVLGGGKNTERIPDADGLEVVAPGGVACVYYVCTKGLVPNADKTDCVEKTAPVTPPATSTPPAKEEKKPSAGSSGTGRPNKCQTAACRSDEKCRECCKLPGDVTKWIPKTKTCQCMNGGTFTKVGDKWSCKVDSSLPVVTSKCDETLLARVREWQTQCAGNEEALAEIKDVLTFCASKSANNDVFLRLYDDLKQTVDTLCVEKDVQSQDDDIEMLIQVSKNRITTAQERLDGIQSGFKVSVWKDADGGFNTSRLVSDSVAGVVLGTAGGLITSSVVKKNQIKGGFEDIQCTVGGQVVAGWGDEFRVGIQ